MKLPVILKNKINKQSGYLATLCTGLFAFSILAVFSAPTTVYADHCGDGLPASHPSHRADCEGGGGGGGDSTSDPALDCDPSDVDSGGCNLFAKYINPIILFLSALVGLAVTIGLVIGGIRYSASGGDPAQASAAKKQIRNAIVALIVFLFFLTALRWLVPGGIW